MASASTMDSSQLLVERDEVDMQIEREAEGQINIKELESHLNSTIIECKTRIAFSSQAKALIAKLSKAEAVIANQSKAKEILEQKLEEMNGKIHCASIENSTLRNENDQFRISLLNMDKEIKELMEKTRENELVLKRKADEIEDKNKQIATLQSSNKRLSNTAKTEKNKYDQKEKEYNHLRDKLSKVKNIAVSSTYKRLRRDEHHAKKEASFQLEQLNGEEQIRYKEYRYNHKEFNAKRLKRREDRQNKHRHLEQGRATQASQGASKAATQGAATQGAATQGASKAATQGAATQGPSKAARR